MQNNTHTHSKTPPNHSLRKQWQVAARTTGSLTRKRENNMVEGVFMSVLRVAKVQLSKYPFKVFEFDQRHDNTHDAFAMHSFISPYFYFTLECSLSSQFEVKYAFYNCPCEDELRRLLLTYPLDERAKEVALKPNFTTFYEQVLAFQDSKHTYIL